jgi:hypothetical protein
MILVESHSNEHRNAAADGSSLTAPRGQALASLDSSELGGRFYSWRGVSGQRYVCSIFRGDERDVVQTFSSAVVIGVANDRGTRRPVCVMSARELRSPEALDLCRIGVNEWHVHFHIDEARLRDIAASLLH